MLVFWKERLVFLAVPKTGTTAIEGALAPRAAMVLRDPPILKHTPVYRYQRFVLPLLQKGGVEGFDTLAVVRHPVDWLSSWYRYRHRDDIEGHQNSTRGISFDTFVTEYCKGKPAPYAAVGSQAKFLGLTDGKPAVTYLFRYEAAPALQSWLEDRLSMTLDLPRLNVSPQMSLALSPDVRALLERKRADEFVAWEAGRH